MSQQKIASVKAEPPSLLTIVWGNGKETKVDVVEYLSAPGYQKLSNFNFLATVEVEEWGHGIEWNDGEAGIDADTLYRLGKEQAGAAFPVSDFNAWMQRNGLSLAAAAKAL